MQVVGGDQNKESKGKTSFMCVKGEVYMKILKIIEIYITENRNDNKQIKTDFFEIYFHNEGEGAEAP